MGEEQLAWLKQFAHFTLNNDEAKALILAKETGAVDNAGLRAITGLDTLAASQVLGRLHHQYQLLVKGGQAPPLTTSCQRLTNSHCLLQPLMKAPAQMRVTPWQIRVTSTQIRVTSRQIEVTSAQMRVTSRQICSLV